MPQTINPLEKAREVTIVRRQYEEATTKEERIRLARLLEQLNKREPAE